MTWVETGGTLVDSGFNSGTNGNNLGSPWTVTLSGTGTAKYDNTNTGYKPSDGSLSGMAGKLAGGTAYAYIEETASASAIAELRFWVYLENTNKIRYYACKGGKTFYLRWMNDGNLQVYIGASTGSSPYNTTGYHVIGTYATGLMQYRVTFNYTSKTYTISRRAALGDAWTQLGESSSYNIPFRDATATAFTGSQISMADSSANFWVDEVQYGTISDANVNTKTQGVAVPVRGDGLTKTQAVAVPIVGATLITKTLDGQVTGDTSATTTAKWSFLDVAPVGELSVSSGQTVFIDSLAYFRTAIQPLGNGTYRLKARNTAITFDLNVVTAAHATYAFRLRLWKDASNYYELLIAKTAGGTSDLRRVTAGTPTSLGTVAKGIAAGTTKQVVLKRTGNVWNAWIDGSRIGPITDASPLTGALTIAADAQAFGSDVRVGNLEVDLDSALTVRNVPTGGSARLYDAAGSTIASGTESSGTVSLDLTTSAFPLTGYVQVFTDSYTTAATSGRFPGDDGTGLRTTTFRGGDELHYDLTSHQVIGTRFAKFYATTQANAHNGVVYNGNYAYGVAIGPESSLVAFKRDLTAQNSISETYEIGGPGTLVDQHATCDVVADSDGYLHLIYDGYTYDNPLYYRKSNTPWGWNDWGAATELTGAKGLTGGLMMDQADKLHLVGVKAGNGGIAPPNSLIYLSKPDGGSWSSVTTLATNQVGWYYYFADCTLGKESSGQKSLNVAWFNFDVAFTGTYRNANFIRSTDGGATWRGLNAGAYTLPLSTNASTGVVTGCETIYAGTDAYVSRLCADSSDSTVMHVTMQKLGSLSDPVYIRGTTTGGWAAASYTFTGLNTGPVIETVLDNIVVLGAVVGTPNTIVRYNSGDSGVTWKGPTTMVSAANTDYPPQWYWAKATRIPQSENLRVLWQARYSSYTSSSDESGEGTSALYIADVQAVSAITQTLAVAAYYRGTSTTSVAVPAIIRPTATQGVAVAVAATSSTTTKTQSVAVKVWAAVTKTQTVAVRVYSGPAPAYIATPTSVSSSQSGASSLSSPQSGSSTLVPADSHPVTG